MKTLILFIASLAAVFGQGYKLNPFTGQLDLVGGYAAPSGYSATITAQTATTVTAATHGQGTVPVAYCFDNASPANAVSCAYTVSSIGDVVFTWSPAFTGSVIIRGPGADAGAAGNVVGPASSTAGAVAFYSGTSGKVLTQDAAFNWDSASKRFIVGTNSPSVDVAPIILARAVTGDSVFAHGIQDESTFVSTTTGGYASFNSVASFGSANPLNHVYGLQYMPTFSGAKTVTTTIGIYASPSVGTGTTVTSNYGVYVDDYAGVGAVEQSFGLYIAALSKPSVGYGVYSVSPNRNYFGGRTGVGVGSTAFLSKLHVAEDVAPTTGNQYAQLVITGTTSMAKQLRIGYDTNANVGAIQAEIAGTGFSPLSLQYAGGNVLVGGSTDGNYRLDVQTSGSSGTLRVWDQTLTVGTTSLVVRAGAGQSGNLLSVQDSSGTTLASVSASGTVRSETDVYGVANLLVGSSGSRLRAPTDGVFTLTNNAASDVNRLQFGGTTSSFPAISRSGAELYFKLADDSAGATIRAGGYKSSDGTTGVTVTTCTGFKNGLCISGT